MKTIHRARPERAASAPLVVYGLRPSRRRGTVFQAAPLIPALLWLAGMAGFIAPMILARSSPHPDLLRAAALAWFLIFGLLNGLGLCRALPRRRIHWRRPVDRL